MKKAKVSVIIPVYNEEGNIGELIKRTAGAMNPSGIAYELVIVDDRSTDKTAQIINELSSEFPISLITKKGKPGKAQSLLEGFAAAKSDLLCMIDGDLQYPPEAIPRMLEKMAEGADVVVANRKEFGASLRRRVLSWGFRSFFGRFLHGFTCDVQSGLKIFRKEIIERITIDPSPWTFDLEFLVMARDAGYKIESIPIDFQKRHAGKAKIGLVRASFEMGYAALKLAFSDSAIIPFHPDVEKEKGKGFHYQGIEFVDHSDLPHHESAFHRFTYPQAILLLSLFTLFSWGLIINWHGTLVFLIAILTFLYFLDLAFNFFLIWRSFSKPPEIKITDEYVNSLGERDWPLYTIFCPLYREAEILGQFASAMEKMDYPKDKLQVLLLMEEDDKETMQKAQQLNLPQYFEMFVIPHSLPKTKPKALNYGLSRAKGEFSVIYDAEDIPDPKQLKHAVAAFEMTKGKAFCIQAKLNFYNPHQNILTKIFTTEYSLWFDVVLTGLQSIGAPIPLGGTSNHFRTKDLLHLKGWDAFNVTEDCDLGIRLAKQGYHTAMIDSITLEEANSNFFAWFRQRSRWIKGYIQTYLVHMRRPDQFISRSDTYQLIMFQMVVGAKIISMWINPFLWAVTISYFALRPFVGSLIESFYPPVIFYIGTLSLVFGNFMYFYYYMIGAAKREEWSLIKYAFLVPFYWLMMSVGSWIALDQLVRRPHHWEKTRHGLHLGIVNPAV